MKISLKILLASLLFTVFTIGDVSAQKGQQQGQGMSAGQGQTQGIQAAGERLNRVAQRVNNPEVGEQVRAMVQKHEKVQARTKTALHNMDQRNQAVKLLVGPDYKNAGQVRSDVVSLRNDIEELTAIQEDALPVDAGDVQGAIDELQAEADTLEAQLTEKTSGFSLFGWLGRLLNKY